MMPNKIWSWKRTGTGGWWTKNLSATPAGMEVTPYYHIPDELIEHIRAMNSRSPSSSLIKLLAIFDDEK